MKLDSSVTLYDLEDAYEALTEDQEALELPLDLLYGGVFGIEPGLVQFLATWRASNPNGTLKVPATTTRVSQLLSKRSDVAYWASALYFARQIADLDGHQIQRHDALTHLVPWALRMYDEDLRHMAARERVDLLCIHSAKHEFLPCFYALDTPTAMRGRDDFVQLSRRVFSALSIRWESDPTAISGYAESLGTLIYELVCNTNEHGITDERGNLIRNGIRGLLVRKRVIPRQDVADKLSGRDPKMSSYLFNRVVAAPSSPSIGFLEVSVLDSGIGLARRWLSKDGGKPQPWKDLPLDAELDAVKTCFLKHMTTKASRSSGIGLISVLEHLKQLKAFMRVRTGRLCLYQNFASQQSGEGLIPTHWIKKRPLLAPAVGTTFTICFPI